MNFKTFVKKCSTHNSNPHNIHAYGMRYVEVFECLDDVYIVLNPSLGGNTKICHIYSGQLDDLLVNFNPTGSLDNDVEALLSDYMDEVELKTLTKKR